MVGQLISRPRTASLVLGAGFIAFHLTTLLVNVAPAVVREPLWPFFAPYADGLRLSGRFGVFARYSSKTSVTVYGVARDGGRRSLSESSPARRGVWRRIVDARIPKIQRKLERDDMRAWFGREYVLYFCRQSARAGLELEHAEIAVWRLGGPSASEVVLSVPCEAP